MFTPEQIKELSAPLDKSHVKTRQQAGRELSYVEAWHAIAEANRIFGFDCWNRETVELRQLGEPRQTGDKWRVGYMARVRITVYATSTDGATTTTIKREGCGFGSGIDKDVDQAHESALKEAESDAMKRALMTFGNPFGLALYDKTQANVQAAPPPPPPEESAIYGAAKIAMEMAAEQGGKAGLELWAKNNGPAMQKMEKEDPAIYQAVRRLYAKTLHDLAAAKQPEAA